MDASRVTRREVLKQAAFAGLVLPLLGAVPGLHAADAPAAPAPGPLPALELGLVGYSLRSLSVDAGIEALRALGVTHYSVFRTQVPILLSTPDVCAAMAKKYREAGITLTGTGVVTLPADEAAHRRAFECGKAAGLTTMTASYAVPPDAATLALTERFVREYDIRLAFHNHGPEDKIFPSPFDVWKAVQPYDPRMGLCIDVGHAARAGADPVEAILACRSRLYDVHLKDTTAGAGVKKDQPVLLGKGRLDLRGIFTALRKIGYPYQAGLEYELEGPDPLRGIAQSYGYMRGMADALAAA
jgi:inosose dehydratase